MTKYIFSTFCMFLLLLSASPYCETAQKKEPRVPPGQGLSNCLKVNSRASLIHLGSIDSFDITEGGVKAARLLFNALNEKKDQALRVTSARAAMDVYREIIPSENFGGEYTALYWFCDYIVGTPEAKQNMMKDRYVEGFFHFFADNNYSVLKEYLKRKYHLAEIGDENTHYAAQRMGFLEDFILFNNPRRESWEKTSKIIQALDLKPDQIVADIGSGPGYYTFKFADIVGDKGRIYATDVNPDHTKYVKEFAQKNGIKNVEAIGCRPDDINLDKVEGKVDMVFMCSLYHIIYATSSEPSKDAFIASIKKVLKKDGKFVVVDNAFVKNEKLPYHGPYITKELIIKQLEYYGFRLVATHQFIPQRYVLVFKLTTEQKKPGIQGTDSAHFAAPDCIEITSKASLLHLPNSIDPELTPGGREAASLLFTALETNDKNAAKLALAKYKELIPKEKFGDEYTAFQWLCEYLLASEQERLTLLKTEYNADYFRFLAANDFEVLRNYIKDRYLRKPQEELEQEPLPDVEKERQEQEQNKPLLTLSEMIFARDFILFNNPNREKWEKTSRILEILELKPGDYVADVGCGPGYYTLKFANLVGNEGRVYAVDTNKDHLTYVADAAKRHHFSNIETVSSKLNDARLPPDSVDMVFLCSLYNLVYSTSMEYVKDQFIDSIRRALKKDGVLVIVDNDVVFLPTLPYHGPYIARELIISQLKYYGFKLVKQYQFIPQRYVLIFKMV